MNSQIKNAVTGGAIASLSIVIVVAIAAYIFGPALAAYGYFVGWWSFENVVIALLFFAIYSGGGGGD
jgi:hypothetical protein